jgi:ABC-type uncharacterized transport system substrate-binding protein
MFSVFWFDRVGKPRERVPQSSPRPKRATAIVPIVFATAADPVGAGLVASLPRPGGNVTRLSIQSTDLAGKRHELLRQVVPGLHRLAAIASVGSPAAMPGMDEVQAAGLLARRAPQACRVAAI